MKQRFKEGDSVVRVNEESIGNRLWCEACKQVGLHPFAPVKVTQINVYGHPIFHSVHPTDSWSFSSFVIYVSEKELDEYM